MNTQPVDESLKKKYVRDSDSLSVSEKARNIKASIDQLEVNLTQPRTKVKLRSHKKQSPRKEQMKARIFRNQKISDLF